MEQIIQRYQDVLTQKLLESGLYTVIQIKPMPGKERHDIHLLWMLSEILENTEQSETKKHRWLGYVQGIMIAKEYLTVAEERELTRNIFNGK